MQASMSRKSKVLSLSIAQAILVLSNLIAGMVFTRVLSAKDYGTYLQTFLAYEFALPLLTMGLPTALYYFLAGENNDQKRLVFENMLLLFGVGVIFSLFLLFGGIDLLSNRFNNDDIRETMKLLIWYPLYTFPVLLASSVWISKGKAKLNAVFNVVTGIVTTLLLIVVVSITRNYEATVLVRVLLPLVFFPIYLYLIFSNVPGRFNRPRLDSMWGILKFSIPLGLASVFGTLSTQLSSLIVSLLTSPEAYATYAVGAKEIPLIGVVTGSIAVVIMADMASKIKEGDVRYALQLFKKAAVISASFLFPIMCFLMANSEQFIKILYTEKYIDSVVPFRIYLLIIPIRIAYYGSAFIAFGKTKQVLYRSVFDLILTGLFCYIFVYSFGERGAALGLILTLFVWTVPYNMYTLSKYFQCSFYEILPFKNLLRILLISIVCAIVSLSTHVLSLNSGILFVISGLIFFALYIVLSWQANPEFQQIIDQYRKKLKF